MKNINKKGFTLVELLAVIVILLAISVIAVSSISAAIERQNNKKDEATKKIIVSYAKLYFDEYKNSLSSTPCVNVSTLINVYNIDSKTLVSSDGNSFDGSVKYISNKYDYYTEQCS